MIRKLSLFFVCLAGFGVALIPAATAQQNLSDLFPEGGGGFGVDLQDGPPSDPISVTAKLIPVDALTVDVKVTLNVAAPYYS